MSTSGHRIKLPGFALDAKTGKLKKSTRKLSVSTRIAQKKKPTMTYKRGK
jgi:hypothetical protein